MRRQPPPVTANTTIVEFRHQFPLGATSRVTLLDEDGRYAGIVQTAAAFAEGLDASSSVATLAINQDAALAPDLDIVVVMKRFDASGADELALLDPDRHVLGLVSETHVRRRDGEELDKSRRELFGE